MIKYNKQIELNLHRNGEWKIHTDRGDTYNTLPYSNINEWWHSQIQNELRTWQKDIVIADTANIFGRLILYNVFKQGRGYNQNHDICLINNEQYNIWVLSTQNDFWITYSQANNIIFKLEDSLGSIMKAEDRLVMYSVYDDLKQQFNPNNDCRYAKY